MNKKVHIYLGFALTIIGFSLIISNSELSLIKPTGWFFFIAGVVYTTLVFFEIPDSSNS